MTYTLIALFLATGSHYVERQHLTLHQCAAHAAMTRAATDGIADRVGAVRYLCIAEARS